MPYVSGPRPARLDHPLDLHSLNWRAYTLADQPEVSRDEIAVGRHFGEITSIAVMHRFPITRRASLLNNNSPQRWYSVVTSLKNAPDTITNIDEAMNRHVALNTSNGERWSIRHKGYEEIASIVVDGRDAAVTTRRLDGLTAIGADLDDRWASVVVPDIVNGALKLELVAL